MTHDDYIKKRDDVLEATLVKMAGYESMADLYALDNGDPDDYHAMSYTLHLIENLKPEAAQVIDALVFEVIGEEPGTLISTEPRIEADVAWNGNMRTRMDLRSEQRHIVTGGDDE